MNAALVHVTYAQRRRYQNIHVVCIDIPPHLLLLLPPPAPKKNKLLHHIRFLQLDIPCAQEITFKVIAAFAVLATTFPFRGVGNILTRAASVLSALVLPAGLFASTSAYEGPGASDNTPRMTAALEAVVTEQDIAQFLGDLARAPTETEAEEAAAARWISR